MSDGYPETESEKYERIMSDLGIKRRLSDLKAEMQTMIEHTQGYPSVGWLEQLSIDAHSLAVLLEKGTKRFYGK